MSNILSLELKNISKNIIDKTYFYNAFLYFVNNTKYDINLLKLYCNFIENFEDYNENDKHDLYDTNIKPFIECYINYTEEQKNILNYYNQLDDLYNDVISYYFNIPINSNKKYNIPKYIYKVLYFIFDNNNFYLAQNLAEIIFKN